MFLLPLLLFNKIFVPSTRLDSRLYETAVKFVSNEDSLFSFV